MNRKQGIKTNKNGKEINKPGQTRRFKEEIGRFEETEDVTKYGEFISSYFALKKEEKKKEKANQLEQMTSKKQNNK